MTRILRRHATTIVVALVTATVVAGGPAVARAVYDAVNADKVDGRHAVSAGTSKSRRAGKLVATNGRGQLPDNIIAKAPNANLLDGLDAAQLQRRFSRTLVVSPASTASASGTRLRNALSGIPTSGDAAPTAAKPWLIHLEPGTYHLGVTGLQTRAFVFIQGSGMDATTIVCTCGGDEPEMAELLANVPNYTIFSSGDTALRGLSVVNDGGLEQLAFGIVMDGGALDLTEVRVTATSGNAAIGIFALRMPADVRAIVRSSVIQAGDGTASNETGIYALDNGRIELSDAKVHGASAPLYQQGGSIVAITSQLDGTLLPASRCVQSFDGNYNAVDADCDQAP